MASRPPGSGGRRWSAVIWPSSPPPLPAIGFDGPYGLWETDGGGAFMSYDMADHQGFIYDDQLRHPLLRPSENTVTANDRRYATWKAEVLSGRGEIYLALRDVDLTSGDAILEFVSTFGVLNLRALDAPAAGRRWYGKASPQPVPLRILRHYPGFGDDTREGSSDSSMRESVVGICEAERAAAPVWIIEETLHEFLYGADLIRDLTTAWTCLRNGEDPRVEAWQNPLMPTSDMSENLSVSATTEFVERTLSDVLERFSPRVYLRDEDGRRTFRSAPGSPSPRDVTLFEVLILELYRHIAEDAAYKRCEKCNRLFVRQEGGAVHGQSRMTGVKYCTRSCAKAAAQQKYRRRQQKARRAADRSSTPRATQR